MARASIKASVYLPDPVAPESMMACGKRSRASISRRRWMVSELPAKSEKGITPVTSEQTYQRTYDGAPAFPARPSDCITLQLLSEHARETPAPPLHFQLLPHQFHDNCMSLVGRAARIYQVHALRLAVCDRHVGMADASKKSSIFLLEAVLVSCPAFLCPRACSIAPPGAFHAESDVIIEQES